MIVIFSLFATGAFSSRERIALGKPDLGGSDPQIIGRHGIRLDGRIDVGARLETEAGLTRSLPRTSVAKPCPGERINEF